MEVIMTNESPSYFSILPACVRYDEKLKPMERLMYSEISALTNKYGYCNASNAYFAKLYKKSLETVSRWISNLAKRGYIRTEVEAEKGNQRRIYLLTETSRPIDEKIKTPIDEKIKHNNTSINNKYNTPKPPQVGAVSQSENKKRESQRRSQRTNTRATGKNQRAQGTNPRALHASLETKPIYHKPYKPIVCKVTNAQYLKWLTNTYGIEMANKAKVIINTCSCNKKPGSKETRLDAPVSV
jgi:hypothetical protein